MMLEQLLTGSEAFVQFTEDALTMAVYVVEYGPIVGAILLCLFLILLLIVIITNMKVSALQSEINGLRKQLREEKEGAKNGEDAQ